MKPEDKQLLLKDLCARLPYNVIGLYSWKNREPYNRELTGCLFDELKSSWDSTEDSQFLPYLRPMSSMTEEEMKSLPFPWVNNFGIISSYQEKEGFLEITHDECSCIIDWLNKKMFDFRGLIPKGLAISTEEFNPYIG